MVASVLTFFLLFGGFAEAGQRAATVPSPEQRDAAAGWAAERKGSVSWAVIDTAGRLRGRDAGRRYPTASVTKALMLVAALRQVGGDRPAPGDLAELLGPMMRVSSNRAAHVVYRRVGRDQGLAAVVRAARMRRVVLNGTWSNVLVSAADVARFFRAADRLVPARHRPYARRLLEEIDPRQSWGLPRALRRRGFRVLFKGGWRAKLVHQGALLERDGRRLALAVLTDDNPEHWYGRSTIEGIARRLLSG